MGPRDRTRQEIIDLLGRAAEQAEHAEAYHAAAEDPAALKGPAAHQAACDATAMQLIELAGGAENFIHGRGDAGTTLARLDKALEPVLEMRTAHTHPERVSAPPPITPQRLRAMIGQVQAALGNIDPDTLRIERRDQREALRDIGRGVAQIERDGLPDPEALRPRDLHYAGYYREIQFARLAKATDLYNNWKPSFRHQDVRSVDINRRIFAADDMAHRFHALREGADKNLLPDSVVVPKGGDVTAGRPRSEVMRELRREFQTPPERLAEAEARVSELHRESVQGLADTYARMVGDRTAAALIRDYVQRREPRLDRETIDAMRAALEVAAAPSGDYAALPETVRTRCIELCIALDEQDDSRLLVIIDAAESRRDVGRDQEVRGKPVGAAAAVETSGAATGNAPAQEQAVVKGHQRAYSRWTDEPLDETTDLSQSDGIGQSH